MRHVARASDPPTRYSRSWGAAPWHGAPRLSAALPLRCERTLAGTRCRRAGRRLRGSLLPLGAQHLDDRLEGKPLGDLVAGAEHLAELGARELLHLEALLLGVVGSQVLKLLLVADAHEVERRDGHHAELLRVGLGEVLRLEGAVEVLAVDRRLGARHVAPDDEV